MERFLNAYNSMTSACLDESITSQASKAKTKMNTKLRKKEKSDEQLLSS